MNCSLSTSSNSDKNSGSSEGASPTAAAGKGAGTIGGGIIRRSRRSFNAASSFRPEFSLDGLPQRNLTPMTAVTTNLATGTTSYTTVAKAKKATQQQQQEPANHGAHHPRHSQPCPPTVDRDDGDDCCRGHSDNNNIRKNITNNNNATSASSTTWHEGHTPASDATPASRSDSGPTKVTANLYLGGQADAANAILLRQLRIRRILNVAGEISPHPLEVSPASPRGSRHSCCHTLHTSQYESDAGSSSSDDEEVGTEIQTLHIKLRDHSDENIAAHFDEALAFIREGIVNGEAVLVHCRFGVSRSATIVLAYLMTYGASSNYSLEKEEERRMPYEMAFDHVKALRSQVSPNLGFVLALHELEFQLQVSSNKNDSRVVGEGDVVAGSNVVPHATCGKEEELEVPLSCHHQQQQMAHAFLFSPETSTSPGFGQSVSCN